MPDLIDTAIGLYETAEALLDKDMPAADTWHYLASSNVVGFKYERSPFAGGGNTLTVRFKTPSEYEYLNVPNSVIKELAEASSPGAFVTANLRNRYTTNRIA